MALVPVDYPERIKRLRGRLGLTQADLAARLGVSFVTVNRWENAQTKPSPVYWDKLLELAGDVEPSETGSSGRDEAPPMDFTAPADVVRAVAEGERLSFGHMANPTFATEISRIDPLPHQRIAVYDYMLQQERLRFLLADDAGAGKTIMTGLYIREMLSRRLLRRVLIVPPAGLVGNWKRELEKLFSLPFRVVSGSDARSHNPFVGPDSDRVIISVDTLRASSAFNRLREPGVQPYELVVFDEAHKLSANRGPDFYVRRTERYKLAEALAGVNDIDDKWRLNWCAHHLLLLTATPHMGKDYPYFALWRLLEPNILTTLEAFHDFPAEHRRRHFIRRTKEEMVKLDGTPLFPQRVCDTLTYDLSQGAISEQTLYDETTAYLRHVYNRAKLLNRSAARLAMSVFQRRLASSTYALLRSFERRIAKLDELIEQVQDGRLTMEQLLLLQRRIRDEDDVFDGKTADEEWSEGGEEENERQEEKLLQGVVAESLDELRAEREQVVALRELARQVYELGSESKFERLREVVVDPKFSGEKLIIFTEHRDTAEFLVRRLGGMGYTEQIAQIHGGMHYSERDAEVERFRKPVEDGGARFLVCTDAAGEGINLQFCWVMVNYDVPWNPARLEQRMGRIHRYGQSHDPVIILNLVAPKTREGRVLNTLLEKLERIRRELKSDKVFDVIGRVFEGVSIKQYMEMAEEDPDKAAQEIEGRLTKEQVEAIAAREKALYGTGGDVAVELPRLREEADRDLYHRLLPGYVRKYVESAAGHVGLVLEGDPADTFAFRPRRPRVADALLQVLETYPEPLRERLSFVRPDDLDSAIWLHPGEPVFEAFRRLVSDRLGDQALRGAVFVDPAAEKPYLFHLALVSIVRDRDEQYSEFSTEEILDCRLVGVKQFEGSQIVVCPVEHLLLLKGGHGLPPVAQRLALAGNAMADQARAFLMENIARKMAVERRDSLLATIQEREAFLQRGFDYQALELATARSKQTEKARAGNRRAQQELSRIKKLQRQLADRRDEALAVIHREPELISPRDVTFVAHALVVPSSDAVDREQLDANTHDVAMSLAWAYEESCGAIVKDVHTPDLARAAGLPDNPGFDLWSIRPDEKRSIEVKGRAGSGEIEMTDNEWAKACNLRDRYWLYVVYDCATPTPRLLRIQDPFGTLLAKAKGSVVISPSDVLAAAAD